MNTKKDLEQRILADGTSGLSRTGKRPFKSRYGWFCRSISLVTVYTMIWQSAAYAGAFDMSFSAVKESRAHRRSGFFKPSDVKELSEKKRLLIHQRNSLAKNLNRFNRRQSAIYRDTRKLGKDVAKSIMKDQMERNRIGKDLERFAKEVEDVAKVEQMPRMENRRMIMILAPNK